MIDVETRKVRFVPFLNVAAPNGFDVAASDRLGLGRILPPWHRIPHQGR